MMDNFFSELMNAAHERLPIYAAMNAFYLFIRIAPKKISKFSNLERVLMLFQGLLFILFMGILIIELVSSIFKYDIISAKIVSNITLIVAYITTMISFWYYLKLDILDKKFKQE